MTYITRELERKFLKLNDFFKENDHFPAIGEMVICVLDFVFVENIQHLLGRHLGARQEAGAQAGGGDD